MGVFGLVASCNSMGGAAGSQAKQRFGQKRTPILVAGNRAQEVGSQIPPKESVCWGRSQSASTR